MTPKRSIGLLAHVDAGKTTLSEALLAEAGAIRAAGRVDHGDAFLDTHALERKRGITIFSKTARLNTPGGELILVDTPGHADLGAEAERALQALDHAVLVVSAAEGVQAHTRTLWELLGRYAIPCTFFINKTDLPGAGAARALEEIRSLLTDAAADLSGGETPAFFEEAALADEALLEAYEETGGVPDRLIRDAVRRRRLFLCFSGSALRGAGVGALLKGLDRFVTPLTLTEAFGAKVYRADTDKDGKRLAFLKITGGRLSVRDALRDPRTGEEAKVDGLRLYSGEKYASVQTVEAGEICAVTGCAFLRPGDGLGAAAAARAPLLAPAFSYALELPDGRDVHTAYETLKVLGAEDPTLGLCLEAGEIRLRPMGGVQLEILTSVIETRFGMKTSFGRPRVLYKETVADTVEGVGHFEPLRHYAEVHVLIKPGEPGSGVRVSSALGTDQLDLNWQRLILTHLTEKTHVGVLTGSPLTDVELVLVGGRAHPKHTEGGDFRQATYRAVRQGLRRAKSVLLEPYEAFTLELPAGSLGRALTELDRIGAAFAPPETLGDTAKLTGEAPAAALAAFAEDLVRYTHGMGRLSHSCCGMRPCADAAAVVKEIGYDPDADTENPCDSVFCAHGAGYNVKWNEVPAHMHLPSALSRPKRAADEDAPARPVHTAGSSGGDLFALDRELMRIFEKTYGPVRGRRDPMDVHRHDQPVTRPVKKAKDAGPRYLGTEYLLVDGYNVIWSWEPLRALADREMADARDALINLLCSYRGYRQCEAILVFDAYRVKGGEREIEQTGGISVVYTKEAETADTYIEKTSHVLARDHRVRVVTSDGMEGIIILGNGALRVSSEAFYEEVKAVEAEIRGYISDA